MKNTADIMIRKMERKIRIHYMCKYGIILLITLILSGAWYFYITGPVEVEAQTNKHSVTPVIDITRPLLLELESTPEPAGNSDIMKPRKANGIKKEIINERYVPTVQPITNKFDEPTDLYVSCLKLNVRSGCGENYPVVDTVTYGNTVKGIGSAVNEAGDEWIQIYNGEGAQYVKSEYVSDKPVNKYIGDFYITYYCGCEICCDVAGRATASGKMPTSGHTVAADTFLPFGTKLLIDGHVYTVEDRGGAIKGNRIDIYCDTHENALSHRTKSVSVWIVNNEVEYY